MSQLAICAAVYATIMLVLMISILAAWIFSDDFLDNSVKDLGYAICAAILWPVALVMFFGMVLYMLTWPQTRWYKLSRRETKHETL